MESHKEPWLCLSSWRAYVLFLESLVNGKLQEQLYISHYFIHLKLEMPIITSPYR